MPKGLVNMRFVVTCIIFYMLTFPLVAQTVTEKPRLIVGIMVDGLRQEHIDELWNYFDSNGLKTLTKEGARFDNMRYDIVPAGMASDVATVMTGTTPTFHGITGNHFYNRKTNQIESIIEDENQIGIGTDYNYSAHKLLSSTISDEIKLAQPSLSRVYAVAIEPHAAIMMGGHTASSVAWIDNVFFKWVSTGYYTDGLASSADEMNMDDTFETMVNKKWQPLYPTNSYLWNFDGKKAITYTPTDKEKEGTSRCIIRNTPIANTLVTELGVKLIKKEKLGTNSTPDMLMLQYTLRVPNEQYTTIKSLEKEDMYLRLDKDIKYLLKTIKDEVGLKNTLIFLFANKTGSHTPIELGNNKIPAGYFNASRSMALLNTYLMALYGQEKWVDGYYGKNIMLNRRKIEEKRIDINEIQQIVANFMLEFEGIRIAYTAAQIQSMPFSHDLEANNIRNSYHKNTGGDVVISLLPGWLEVGNNNMAVGEMSSFNSNIPFYMYGWNIPPKTIKTSYYITDIAPTISSILNIPYPNACIGKPIEEIIKQ